jgi:hypothetical protein
MAVEQTTAACLKKGDYVLATKFNDGDPGDHFCVGFYDSPLDQDGVWPRHIVVDGKGEPFRATGFRRVEKLDYARGAWIVRHMELIKRMRATHSVWHWHSAPWSELLMMTAENDVEQHNVELDRLCQENIRMTAALMSVVAFPGNAVRIARRGLGWTIAGQVDADLAMWCHAHSREAADQIRRLQEECNALHDLVAGLPEHEDLDDGQ